MAKNQGNASCAEVLFNISNYGGIMGVQRKKTPKNNSKESLSTSQLILSPDETVASAALSEAISEMVGVTFALAWDPPQNSPIFIREVKVNGNNVLPVPSGAMDQASPFQVPLGLFPKGSKLNLSWVVRTFNDVNGIRAFAVAANAGEWKTLGTKAPLANREEWTAEKPYEVPA